MKGFSLKLFLAIITFFIGLSAVSFWYFKRIQISDEKILKEVSSQITVENPCDYPQPQSRELEASEAIYKAECFVIQNGYTDLPPIADKSKLTPEPVWGLTDEEGLKERYNTLDRKAYSYERNAEFWGGSWIIMFRFQLRPENTNYYNEGKYHWGRAVVMSLYGKDIHIQHTNSILDMPESKTIIHKFN